ncbi:L,D-transpeptidase [Tepidibacillus sp. LV47]|uniref:L,D-transpeptidase n=1 Tax=Tepidibacillus sp. LV47 TaxID=3398228 RepID=UPI003AAC1581
MINKTRNTLKVYLNDTVVKTFSVATGKNQNLTPEGHFKIVTKVKNPWYLPKKIPGGDKRNPLGTRWLGLNVPGTGGYKYGIHGTNNPVSIGFHVSQGCIRMYNQDVEWLFRHIPLGTSVTIYSERNS